MVVTSHRKGAMPNKINITLKIGGIVYLSSLFYGNLHSADVIVVTRCANLLISGYLKEYHVTNLLHAVEESIWRCFF